MINLTYRDIIAIEDCLQSSIDMLWKDSGMDSSGEDPKLVLQNYLGNKSEEDVNSVVSTPDQVRRQKQVDYLMDIKKKLEDEMAKASFSFSLTSSISEESNF